MSNDRSSSIQRRLPVTRATGPRMGARHELPRVYRRADLIVLALGVMIGAGIFSIAGRQAATVAGPGVILSFMIAAIAILLAALCYAELSSTMPTAGSAYSFTYVIFGEVWAWIIGLALILNMQLAAAVVARAWSLYAAQTLDDLGIGVPALLAGVVGQVEGFDLFTLFILALLTLIVAGGARIGLRALWIIVTAKLLAIGAVIAVGAAYFTPANLEDIPAPVRAPQGDGDVQSTVLGLVLGDTHVFGWFGIFAAAPAIAFAYIGWDIIATAAEETPDAPRTIPQGMIRGLVFATVIYIAVAVVMVGMVPYTEMDPDAPLTDAFRQVGEGFMVHVINIGAVLGLTTVILVLLVGQTRVLFSMARDGLLPRGLAVVNRQYRTPSRATLVIGLVALVLAETVPVFTLEQLVVMGALFAFLFVAAGVIVMRRTMPDLPRGFSVPLSPLVPALSIVSSLWLMLNLRVDTWFYFAVWMGAGLAVYLLYGRHRSMLAPDAPGYASPRREAERGAGRHRR
ncbi:APC family permease [Thermostaphylospora chromogena]|uniref:Basic amino acid/polyamine antiporter, APA family n=1 Tax=Thermostaphylospora chromogena TaxID=35622 RepID=A0A1H1CGC5_9ACTN|nr:amino acid permease [Thermostaphylospora chromogena]SDQ63188.1 basic amino acid/polyamine antiporter, APA family [Thermostaphylospora chromogena]